MDLSEVFGLDEPICMHLREYTWSETERALREAGFTRMEAVYAGSGSAPEEVPA